ncbi:hypothetical protein V1318_21130 [Lysobacter sp. CCNWLW3]|uniref:hypothetical protein n=1 Tax=unclassified Lysobacter TaxID=2635362 RepID=UPI002FD2C0FD
MSELRNSGKAIVYTVGLFAFAFAIGAWLAGYAAPGHQAAWWISGALLAVGLVVGLKVLEAAAMLAAPFLLAKMAARWAVTGKPLNPRQDGDRHDWIAYLLFIPSYALFALATGADIGFINGGLGFFLSALVYGLAGVVLGAVAARILLKHAWDAG